jgi:hypothetical protein
MQTTINKDSNVEIDMFKLVEFLETFLPIVDSKIPTNINAGGCGVFAKHLNRFLTEMGVPSKIVFIGEKSEKEDMDYLINNRKFKNTCGTSHCLVAISEYLYFDSTGVFRNPKIGTDNEKSDCYASDISEDILDLIIANKNCWNPTFDRKCESNIVEELSQIKDQYSLFLEGKFDMKPSISTRLTPHTIRYSSGGGRGLFGLLGLNR